MPYFSPGKENNEWQDTIDVLLDTAEGIAKKSVVKVIHNQEKEVEALYFQLESQKKLYQKGRTTMTQPTTGSVFYEIGDKGIHL